MSDLLTNDLECADALVDMSNVLRNTALGGRGPADLVRLERVGAALAELYGAERIAMLAVADNSLLSRSDLFLNPLQKREIRGWADSGLILTEGKADIRLLSIAEETGLPIITSDKFRGHRSEFPWLNGSDDAVLQPQADSHGNVFLQHVTLLRDEEWLLSRSEEEDVLRQQGLIGRVDLLGRYWGCPEPHCARHDPAGSPFVLLPLVRGGRLLCEQHGLTMVDRGPRPLVAQLKIMQAGQERKRFPVAQDQPVTAGRSRHGIDLSPYLDEQAKSAVSRVHLRFDLDADKLTVTDVSKNGSTLILANGTRREFHQATRPFTVGERLEICPGLEIIRSGRRYPAELAAARGMPPRAGLSSTPTVLL
jgi:hypothetical protein